MKHIKINSVTWNGIVPPSPPEGLNWDESMLTLYIVDADNVWLSWVMPEQFRVFLAQSIDYGEVEPFESESMSDSEAPEIRGLNADDLKEMLAMKHCEAAVELVKQGRGT